MRVWYEGTRALVRMSFQGLGIRAFARALDSTWLWAGIYLRMENQTYIKMENETETRVTILGLHANPLARNQTVGRSQMNMSHLKTSSTKQTVEAVNPKP